MNNIFDYELYGDILRSPSSLEVGNENTTAKQMMADRKELSEILKLLKEEIEKVDKNNILVNEYNELVKKIEKRVKEFDNGKNIPNGSINLNKIDKDFIQDLKNLVIDTTYETCKCFIPFLDDKGNFCVSIPRSWNDIEFSTDENGRLNLRF